MREKQSSVRVNPEEVSPKLASSRPVKYTANQNWGPLGPPIAVPKRTKGDKRDEAEYLAKVIMTHAAKYVDRYRKTRPQQAEGWGKNTLLVALLHDFTRLHWRLTHRSTDEIEETLRLEAQTCFNYLEYTAEADLAGNSKAKRHSKMRT